MNIQEIIEHWDRTGGVAYVVTEAMGEATGQKDFHLHHDEAREVVIYQDHHLTELREACGNLLAALDVLGLPDADEWRMIKECETLLTNTIKDIEQHDQVLD